MNRNKQESPQFYPCPQSLQYGGSPSRIEEKPIPQKPEPNPLECTESTFKQNFENAG